MKGLNLSKTRKLKKEFGSITDSIVWKFYLVLTGLSDILDYKQFDLWGFLSALWNILWYINHGVMK